MTFRLHQIYTDVCLAIFNILRNGQLRPRSYFFYTSVKWQGKEKRKTEKRKSMHTV